MRRCPNCQSIWVCWNAGKPSETEWWHECHNCAHAFVTQAVVDDGVPYETLMEIGPFLVEPGLFDKNFQRDMELLEKAFNAET